MQFTTITMRTLIHVNRRWLIPRPQTRMVAMVMQSEVLTLQGCSTRRARCRRGESGTPNLRNVLVSRERFFRKIPTIPDTARAVDRFASLSYHYLADEISYFHPLGPSPLDKIKNFQDFIRLGNVVGHSAIVQW